MLCGGGGGLGRVRALGWKWEVSHVGKFTIEGLWAVVVL